MRPDEDKCQVIVSGHVFKDATVKELIDDNFQVLECINCGLRVIKIEEKETYVIPSGREWILYM